MLAARTSGDLNVWAVGSAAYAAELKIHEALRAEEERE
jgi:hypothetical protein